PKRDQVLMAGPELKLHDLKTGNVVRQFGAGKDGNNRAHLAILPDGTKFFASRMNDPKIECWDLAGTKLELHEGHTAPITGLVLMPDGKQLISSSLDGTVRVWDAGVLKETNKLELNGRPVEALAMSPATRLIAVAVGEDILVHNFETKRSVHNVG